MGSKGPKEQTTTTSSGPPEWVRPYIETGLQQGLNLYRNQPLYQDPTLPDAAAQGFAMQQQAAQNPALIDPAIGLAQQTLGGDFLSADALRGAARAELDDVVGGTLGGFEAMGRSGSGLAANALGRGVTSALAPVYGRERAMQQQTLGAVPGLEGLRYAPGQAMADTALQQRGIEDAYYQEPWDRLGRYSQMLGATAPMAGQIGTHTQPIHRPSPFSQLLGLGMTGLGVAGGLGWSPFGRGG